MTFGEKLKTARMQAGITLDKLSAEIGVARRTLINYESSQTLPPIDFLPKVSKFFGIPIESLITEDEEVLAQAYEKGGKKAMREVDELVHEVSGIFAGGRLSEDDKDAVMKALQNAYWIAKEENKKKFTPKKHRKTT